MVKATTIMVRSETKELLDKAKTLLKKKSYDEVIKIALKKLLNVPDTLFGIDKGKIAEFKEEDRLFWVEE